MIVSARYTRRRLKSSTKTKYCELSDRSDTVIVYFWAFIERRGSLSTGKKKVVISAKG